MRIVLILLCASLAVMPACVCGGSSALDTPEAAPAQQPDAAGLSRDQKRIPLPFKKLPLGRAGAPGNSP